jgi:hypothetical protein
MTDETIDLEQRRGMTAQKATDLRRLLAEVETNERALRQRQDELESHLVAAAAGRKLPRRRAIFSSFFPRRPQQRIPGDRSCSPPCSMISSGFPTNDRWCCEYGGARGARVARLFLAECGGEAIADSLNGLPG